VDIISSTRDVNRISRANGETLKVRTLQALSTEAVDDLHMATLQVLAETGIAVHWDPALHVFAEAGARVDWRTHIVYLPESLVEEGLGKTPHRFLFTARDAQYTLELAKGSTYFTNGFGATYVLDAASRERRVATLEDLARFTRLADYLPHVDYPITQCIPQDVSKELVGQYMALTMLANTVKHVYCPTFSLDGALDFMEMAAIVLGGEDALRRNPTFINSMICPTSPLQYSADAAARLMAFSRVRVPFGIWSAPLAGATGPATLAGTAVVQNAEVLAGVVLAQLVKPGTPILYGTGASVMDMTYGTPAYAAPELSIFNVVTAQLAQRYGLPTYGTGGVIDAKVPDEQAAYESMLSSVVGSLAGITIVHDAVYGILESGMTACYEQLLICHEMVGMVRRVLEGLEVTPETLALPVIHAVQPGGTFLNQQHTLRTFRREHWFPDLTDRAPRSEWQQQGAKDVVQRARERIHEIEATHKPEPLDPDILKALYGVIDARRRAGPGEVTQ
jgi:trimethylamine--corrinoid protein Co-methyltransferase